MSHHVFHVEKFDLSEYGIRLELTWRYRQKLINVFLIKGES